MSAVQTLGNIVADQVAVHSSLRDSVEHVVNRTMPIYRLTLAVHHVITLVRELEHIANQFDFTSSVILKRRSTPRD
jgi:hypothetical protein